MQAKSWRFNHSFFIVVSLLLLFSTTVLAQPTRIIKIVGTHAAVNKGEGSGLIVGDTYQIIRNSMGTDVVIGEARIQAIRSTFSAVEITHVKPNYKVMVGDELAPLYSEETIIYNAPLATNSQMRNYGKVPNLSFPHVGLREFGGSASIQVVKERTVISLDGLMGYFIKPNAKLGFRTMLQKIEDGPTFGVGAGEYTYYMNTEIPTPIKPYAGVLLGLADNTKDIKPAFGCHVGINISRPDSKWANRFEIFLMNAGASIIGFRIGFSVFQ